MNEQIKYQSNIIFIGQEQRTGEQLIKVVLEYFKKENEIAFIEDERGEKIKIYQSQSPHDLKIINLTNGSTPSTKNRFLERYNRQENDNLFVFVFSGTKIIDEAEKESLKNTYNSFNTKRYNNIFCAIDVEEREREREIEDYINGELRVIFANEGNLDEDSYRKRVFYINIQQGLNSIENSNNSPLEELNKLDNSSAYKFIKEFQAFLNYRKAKVIDKPEVQKVEPAKVEPAKVEPANPIRSRLIKNIIDKRKPLSNRIEKIKNNLQTISSSLDVLEEHRDRLLTRFNDKASISAKLQEIDFFKTKSLIANELITLDKLKFRFCRNTLNIGVIGRARQGKSRLLQSLTGLTAAEIPDGSGQHCTGVKSTIHHNPAFEPSGEVWFHTERSFLDEVIAPYYEQLNLGTRPISLDEFSRISLPNLPENISGAEVGAKYERLKRYYQDFERYSSLLQEPSPRRITREKIREYVAQDNLEGERIYYNYLAVKEVKIICNFPNNDVGQIALIDLPGLGDTGIGDEKRMVETISQDIDTVLFVRMPKPNGDFWGDVDVRLYDIVRSALADLPLELWSFMILNQLDDNSNKKLCQQLERDIYNKHIKVSACVTANCADRAETNNKVLDRVLDYLAANITTLDQQYASSCQKRLKQIQTSIDAELEKASKALGQAPSEQGTAKFEFLFDRLWKEVTSGLEVLLKRLGTEVTEQDRELKKAVEEAIQNSYDNSKIPSSLEEIETRRDDEGSYEIAYNKYLNEIRANLSQQFLCLDNGLKKSLVQLKTQVSDVLIQKGHLGGLTDRQGAEFFEQIALQIPDQFIEGEPSGLKYGFNLLAEFQLSYRGMIQHRIRKCLNDLTPDKKSLPLPNPPNAEHIMSNLKVLHGEAVYKCETALKEILCEPSQAAFAIVEEFLDRVLRAENIKIEWRIFLSQERSSIWPDEFNSIEENSRLRRDWKEKIQQTKRLNQPESLFFIDDSIKLSN